MFNICVIQFVTASFLQNGITNRIYYKLYNQNKGNLMGCGTSQQSVSNVNLIAKDLYNRKELIGVGHHGRVYRCIHQQDNKQYAVKVIDQLQNQANYNVFKQSYVDMVHRLKSLQHPRIAQYIHFQLNEKQLSIVMEISKEGTLKKYIQKQGKLLEQLASHIVQCILQGLYYLHTNNILHKDLKTNNVLMYPNQITKLSDCSLAELYDARLLLKTKQTKGQNLNPFMRGDSVPYMAPEVIKNLGVTQKSDVWSVGCILVEILTGKVPWSNINPIFQQAFKVINVSKYPPFPAGITPECQKFLQSCLAVNPAKRSSAKQLLNHPFIRTHSKQGGLHFQLQHSNSSPKLKQNDKANRVASRGSRADNNEKTQDLMKTPLNTEKKYMDENSESASNKYVSTNRSQNRKNARNSRVSKQSKSSFNIFQPEVSKSVSRMSQGKQLMSISKQDILPEIIEDQDDINVVMLNNKKVTMSSPLNKKYEMKMKTEQTEYETSRQFRNSSQMEGGNTNGLSGRSKRDININDSFQNPNKLETQPSLVISQFDQNKEYFKRPLKLLKKKMQQKRSGNSSNFSSSYIQNQSSAHLQIQKLYKDQKQKDTHKIRSNTESSRQEIIINTQLAKAERDRYINEQLHIKRQREQDKVKWQKQLKKQAEILKKELSHRYAYPYANLPV